MSLAKELRKLGEKLPRNWRKQFVFTQTCGRDGHGFEGDKKVASKAIHLMSAEHAVLVLSRQLKLATL